MYWHQTSYQCIDIPPILSFLIRRPICGQVSKYIQSRVANSPAGQYLISGFARRFVSLDAVKLIRASSNRQPSNVPRGSGWEIRVPISGLLKNSPSPHRQKDEKKPLSLPLRGLFVHGACILDWESLVYVCTPHKRSYSVVCILEVVGCGELGASGFNAAVLEGNLQQRWKSLAVVPRTKEDGNEDEEEGKGQEKECFRIMPCGSAQPSKLSAVGRPCLEHYVSRLNIHTLKYAYVQGNLYHGKSTFLSLSH